MKLSICIPTFNRPSSIHNCLNSIFLNKNKNNNHYEVCISDNSTNNETESIVLQYKDKLSINYIKNDNNIGRVKNYIQVIDIAKGDFIWLLGDDDLLLPNSLNELIKLIFKYQEKIDFFYINSFLLDSEYVFSYKQPFDTSSLPVKMKSFSKKLISEELEFFDLINPKIAFDFLGGMYLSVFRKKNWTENINYLDKSALNDLRTFSSYDNTFPHVKVFSRAFRNSKAFYNHIPLSISLSGQREWSEMYPLVRSFRLIESLYFFRKNGLPLFKFMHYKNYALRFFMQDLIKIMLNGNRAGLEFIEIRKHIIYNIFYPNTYLSIIYFLLRKLGFKI